MKKLFKKYEASGGIKMHTIELKNITKEYDDVTIIEDLNLTIKENEFWTLLGPSGCGKTTILRMIGGFETPTSGKIYFNGKDITSVPSHERKINTVFQKYALFPHLNVYENIAFGLRIKKLEESKIEEKVEKMLRLVNLEGYENREIDSLSGGQQQRIAIARALVNEPKVLLLDESLSALDSKLRKGMQIELKNMQKQLGITFIFVTHDQEEALTMSDMIVVMDRGDIQQVGSPVDIYNEPKNIKVAKFIGESNIIDGVMKEDCLVNFANHDFPCVDKGFNKNEMVDVVIRPEDMEIVDLNMGQLVGEVTSVRFKGVHYEMIVRSEDFHWIVHSTLMAPVGNKVGMRIIPDNIHIMKKLGGDEN